MNAKEFLKDKLLSPVLDVDHMEQLLEEYAATRSNTLAKQKLISWAKNVGFDSSSGDLKEIIDLIDNNTRSGWIPVEERLPKVHSLVFMWNELGRLEGFFDYALGFCKTGERVEGVTHWMYIPDNPKANKS